MLFRVEVGLFADGGEDRAFAISRFDKAPETVLCRPRGGFVLKIN